MKKILIVLAVVALGGFLFYKMNSKSTPLSPKDALRTVLLNEKSADFQVRDALVQLAYHQDPDVLKFALERAGSENPKIRAGAGEALGFYETQESDAALAKLLDDTDSTVRLQAMRGLYHVRSPSRVGLIRAQLRRTNLVDAERLKLKEVLYRASDNPEDKKESVEALVAFAKSGNTSKHYQSGLMAASIAPKDPVVLKYIKEMMRNGQEAAFVSTAIYLFADAKDPEVSGNLRRLLKDPQASVRVAAASTISKYCQKDRFTALKEALPAERDPTVVRAMTDVLKLMPGKTSAGVVEAAMRAGTLAGESLKIVQDAWNFLQANSGHDPCDSSR